MMRQLGKPTIFFTFSASEYRWPTLLRTLYRLKNNREWPGTDENLLEEMNPGVRSSLVNNDPVTCCLYFNKLVDTIMNILKSKRCSPFGKYRMVDSFKRAEDQQRGNMHNHGKGWLENDPKEQISEDMPKTIELIDALITTNSSLLRNIRNQHHNHTFTCWKRQKDEENHKCRFGAPFWPLTETKILLPMPKPDTRLASSK